MEKILSLIIPTYNMENYLRQCLNSLLISDIETLDSLDIIIVNDGSKDSSLSIAREYEVKYEGVFRVLDKTNGNYGSCINAALPIAKGKYIKILDADDSFATSTISEYINTLKTIDVDIVISDFNIVDEKEKIRSKRTYNFPRRTIFSFTEYIADQKQLFMHAIAYRTSILKDINYQQTEGISYTDTEWTFTPLSYIKTAYYIPIVVYKYLIGREGQTMAGNVIHQKVTHRLMILKKILSEFNTANSSSMDPSIRKYIERFLNHQIRGLYSSYLLHNKDIKGATDLDKYLNENAPQFIQSSDKYVLAPYFPYRFVWRWRKTRMYPSLLILGLFHTLRKINQLIHQPL